MGQIIWEKLILGWAPQIHEIQSRIGPPEAVQRWYQHGMNLDGMNLQPKVLPVTIEINPDWCKRCGICAYFCHDKVLAFDKTGPPRVEHPERCTLCYLCVRCCPDFAIKVTGGEKK